ncbi:MAG: hypothetical protein GY749_48815, partial [Desulfobacteraceae bacterium]|nr:hypothetical protein [Desulfobacteraceae bacterium]
KVNEINEKLITVLEEKILLLEDQKAINEEIIEIQKEQLFLSGVSNNEVACCDKPKLDKGMYHGYGKKLCQNCGGHIAT